MRKIETCDIMLFSENGWTSKIIKWGTKSKYSHVSICVDPDIHLMIEANGKVRAEDIRRSMECDVYRVKPGYSYDLPKVISFLVDKLNRPYDYLGVIYLGFLKVFCHKKRANKWQRDHDYFCSELTKQAFKAGGLDLIPDMKAEIVSPGDIANSEVVELIIEGEKYE